MKAEVVSQQVKQGRSGEMLFVTVRRTFSQAGQVCLVEEQDIMYRSGEPEGRPSSGGSSVELPVPQAPWSGRPQFSTVKLFIFSAITANAHRIHYDFDYTRSVEGYPGLVVHGPLLILSMLEVVRAGSGDRAVASLSYRLQRPVICGDEVLVEAQPQDDTVQVVMRSSRHDVVASATVILR
jgi:hydroxyacyl-ACP dehydratase HTD2-like protein with hotdog domain